MGTGAVLGLAPAPEYTFLIYVSPVGNYFKVCHLYYLACLSPSCDHSEALVYLSLHWSMDALQS